MKKLKNSDKAEYNKFVLGYPKFHIETSNKAMKYIIKFINVLIHFINSLVYIFALIFKRKNPLFAASRQHFWSQLIGYRHPLLVEPLGYEVNFITTPLRVVLNSFIMIVVVGTIMIINFTSHNQQKVEVDKVKPVIIRQEPIGSISVPIQTTNNIVSSTTADANMPATENISTVENELPPRHIDVSDASKINAVKRLYKEDLYNNNFLTEDFEKTLYINENYHCLDYNPLTQSENPNELYHLSNLKILENGNVQVTIYNSRETDLQFVMKCNKGSCLVDDIIEPKNGWTGGSIKKSIENLYIHEDVCD